MIEKKINKIIDHSEIVRMAQKHFDEETTVMMIEELKEDILKEINKNK